MKNGHRKVKRDRLEINGTVIEAHRAATFSVELEQSGEAKTKITCTLCGKMRENFIKIIPGDRVIVEVSPYDMTKGRIVQRVK